MAEVARSKTGIWRVSLFCRTPRPREGNANAKRYCRPCAPHSCKFTAWHYRRDNRHGTMTLKADEFIRRFLIHVLPSGFQRIRYYVFLCNRQRASKLTRCRELIGAPRAQSQAAADDYRDLYETLTGKSLMQCPACGEGHMLVIKTLPRTPRQWKCDTS